LAPTDAKPDLKQIDDLVPQDSLTDFVEKAMNGNVSQGSASSS